MDVPSPAIGNKGCRARKSCAQVTFSPAVSGGGHGALLKGGVKDARRIPQPPPAVGHDVQLRGGASISTFASPRQSRSSTTTLGGRLAWHGRQRTPSSKWVRGIRLCTRRSFRLSFALSSDQPFKNKARPLSRGSLAESAPLTFAQFIYSSSEL